MKNIFKMLTADFVAGGIVIATVGLIAALVFRVELFGVFSASLIFAAFDCIGYHYLLTDLETIPPLPSTERYYRLFQFVFQTVLSALLWESFSLVAVLSFWILFFFGVDDFLYYLLLRQDFRRENMSWLNFTVFGAVLTWLKRPISWRWMVGFSVLGVIAVILLSGASVA